MNLYEQLSDYAKTAHRVSASAKMLMEDPAKFFATQYEALTHDFDKELMEHSPVSKDYIISKCLRQEAFEMQKTLLSEATMTTTPSGQSIAFVTQALPLVKKVYERLIAMDLVSVQPISQPEAKVFFLEFQNEDGSELSVTKDRDYLNTVEGGPVKEINLKLTSDSIKTEEQKVKAVWSIELEQDLQTYQGLNAETELTSMGQAEILREIDGKIIYKLLAGANGVGTGTGTGAGNINWNINGFLAGDTSTTFRRDYRKTIYDALTDASNLVFKKRYRYCTWIVGHPDAVARLEKLEDFRITSDVDPYEFTVGRHLVGTLSGKWKVYKDPYFPNSTQFLLGYKGTEFGDASGFYAPYIPLYMTPKLIDPNDFKPRKGIMSRFACGTLIKDALATVTLTTS